MHLRYDEDFVEAAVFLCAGGRLHRVPSLQIARFHRTRERLYSVLDPDERNAAFFKLHLEWFREWRLETRLVEPLREFPMLAKTLTLLAFRTARGVKDEGAELYVNDARQRSGVVAMRPERLGSSLELESFLRHEFTHLHDMVDPDFGYLPELQVLSAGPSHQSLARERYRLLWDITIDGRLTRLGRRSLATRDERWREFTRAFAFWEAAQQQLLFDRLWTDPGPTHRALEEVACDPRRVHTTGPCAGAPCPLCGFSTFAWAQPESLSGPTAAAIRSEFPLWTAEQGACARCVALYRGRRSQAPLVV